MKNWILIFSMITLVACQSTPNSSTPSESISPGVSQMEKDTDTGLGYPQSDDNETDSVREPDDYYLHFPVQKDEKELAVLKAMRKKAREVCAAYFSTPRLEEWISGLGKIESNEYFPPLETLFNQQFQSLTTKEHIHYHLTYPERNMQNCSILGYVPGDVKAIVQEFPPNETDHYPSHRQTAYMEANRDSVAYWIKSFLQQKQSVPIEMLALISELQIKSVIPDLNRIFRAQTTKDDLILTAMIQMMNREEYLPWIDAELDHGDWFIELNSENANAILKNAEKFAKEK